jgi:integrase
MGVDENVDDIMARLIGRLTELQVMRAKSGWHNDGGGLYLRVETKKDSHGKERKSRWWVYRYGSGGKRYHGLGPAHTIGLAEAREQARRCRQLILEGADPIAAGKARRAAAAQDAANAKTLAECVEAYHASHCVSWTNQKHAREWKASLATHVLPQIGDLPVASIDTAQVLRVLQPAWTKVPETASRLRSRLESVLDWAKVHGYRNGENPARWRGHLDHLLPSRKKLARVKHHAALPYRDMPAFMQRLRQHDDVEARALEFLILTAARAGEVVGAEWSEIDQAEGWTWVVPATRMKARREHRVPLSRAARAVLDKTPFERRKGPIFPAVSGHMLWKFLRELTDAATVHGLRSSFRDWAAEQTNFPREVAELALAHRVGDDVEHAYRRGDLLPKRRQLAEAWARYCESVPAAETSKVAPIGGGRHG